MSLAVKLERENVIGDFREEFTLALWKELLFGLSILLDRQITANSHYQDRLAVAAYIHFQYRGGDLHFLVCCQWSAAEVGYTG